jgi:hypothetical protein
MQEDRILDIRDTLSEIQLKLKKASDETAIALLELEMAQEYEEWREGLSKRALDYIVSLDTALGEVHQRRQSLLESQLDSIALND